MIRSRPTKVKIQWEFTNFDYDWPRIVFTLKNQRLTVEVRGKTTSKFPKATNKLTFEVENFREKTACEIAMEHENLGRFWHDAVITICRQLDIPIVKRKELRDIQLGGALMDEVEDES